MVGLGVIKIYSVKENQLTKVQGQGFFICHIIVIQGIIRSEM